MNAKGSIGFDAFWRDGYIHVPGLCTVHSALLKSLRGGGNECAAWTHTIGRREMDKAPADCTRTRDKRTVPQSSQLSALRQMGRVMRVLRTAPSEDTKHEKYINPTPTPSGLLPRVHSKPALFLPEMARPMQK